MLSLTQLVLGLLILDVGPEPPLCYYSKALAKLTSPFLEHCELMLTHVIHVVLHFWKSSGSDPVQV